MTNLSEVYTKFIVVGMNNCWGTGPTLDEAKKRAYKPKHFVAFVCHPDTTVSILSGGLNYPIDYPPIKVEERLPKPAKTQKSVPA